MEIVFLWFVFSIVAGIIASSNGRSGFGYFLLSLILSPLVGVILAAALPKINKNTERAALDSGDFKKCPMCTELVRREAVKCRYCGSDFSAAPSGAALSAAPASSRAAYGAGKAVAQMLKRDPSVEKHDGQPGFGMFVFGAVLVAVVIVIAVVIVMGFWLEHP